MVRLLLLGILAFSSQMVWAYTPTLTAGGVPVRWKGKIWLPLAGNPTNQSGLSEAAVFNAVVRGLQRWSKASEGALRFDYWQGSDPAIYEPNSEYNGLSSIYFASNARRGAPSMSSNVLGLTQVWYNADSGEVLEADIILNDLNYRFTEDPKHTSGYGNGGGSGSGRNVYIQNVITHELGHALGLSHSGGLQSTMLFMESPEQALLGCDEHAGIQAIYPGHEAGRRGAIRGSVIAQVNGAALFGAQVVAVSRRRGAVMATTLTDRSGQFVIGGLEPGDYFLMVEPFYAGATALPAYYAGVNAKICNGDTFSRSFLMDAGDSRLRSVSVVAGGVADVSTLVASCAASGGASVAASPASLTGGNGGRTPTLLEGGAGGFGVVDRFSYSNSMYYRVSAFTGRLEVRALGYSLYSPIHAKLDLLDAYGNPVEAQRSERVYIGNSGYVNFDSAVVATDLKTQDYYIQVSATPMSASLYPAGPLSLDSVPFVMLTGSSNEAGPPLEASIPFNARCRMDENFGSYSSPPGAPYRRSTRGKDGGGFGFCGIVSDGGSSSGGEPPGPGAVVGWLLPWLMMLAIARASARSAWMQLHPRPAAANLYV